jgi:NAD(P)-dependent dehydrogenase (short-subunit alcohol dehydrogenase family)
MDLDLMGKLALVTGSTRGFGLASATGLAQMGAEVIINGRDNAVIGEAIAKVRQSSPSVKLHAAAFDLGPAEGCASLVAQFPEVDISSTISDFTSRKPSSISRTPTGRRCSRSPR